MASRGTPDPAAERRGGLVVAARHQVRIHGHGDDRRAVAFNYNDFGSWKVTYDICTGGNPAIVNDFSTADGPLGKEYTIAHID
jgi:hypothetical protein